MNQYQRNLDLKKQILTIALEPSVLLDEQSLSEQYSISRTSLSDVFRWLAGKAYLTFVNNIKK
jgi:DNA-binding GntR family transcriptional regulator